METLLTIVYTWSEEKKYKLVSNLHRIKYKFPLPPGKLENMLGEHTCTFSPQSSGS